MKENKMKIKMKSFSLAVDFWFDLFCFLCYWMVIWRACWSFRPWRHLFSDFCWHSAAAGIFSFFLSFFLSIYLSFFLYFFLPWSFAFNCFSSWHSSPCSASFVCVPPVMQPRVGCVTRFLPSPLWDSLRLFEMLRCCGVLGNGTGTATRLRNPIGAPDGIL